MKALAAAGSVAAKGFMAVEADFTEVADSMVVEGASTVAVDFMEVAAMVDTDN